MYVAELDPGKTISLDLKPGRNAWVQVSRGSVTLNGQSLTQGDGAAISNETALRIAATDDAEVILFDLA
jgi:redox-sensitive bicupin YhaK (pirin superfamily)